MWDMQSGSEGINPGTGQPQGCASPAPQVRAWPSVCFRQATQPWKAAWHVPGGEKQEPDRTVGEVGTGDGTVGGGAGTGQFSEVQTGHFKGTQGPAPRTSPGLGEEAAGLDRQLRSLWGPSLVTWWLWPWEL